MAIPAIIPAIAIPIILLASWAGRARGEALRRRRLPPAPPRARRPSRELLLVRKVIEKIRRSIVTPGELRDGADAADRLDFKKIADYFRRLALRLELERARRERPIPPEPTPPAPPAPPAPPVVEEEEVIEEEEPEPEPEPEPVPVPEPEPKPVPTPPGKPLIHSPIKGVSDSKWRRFVRRMAPGKVGTVSKGYHMGIFLYGSRRLEDLDVIEEDTIKRGIRPAIGSYTGVKPVYYGTWIPPWTMEKFLSSPRLQYDVFAKDMKAARRQVLSRYRGSLGKTYEGKKATLSGLLALHKYAGLRGAGQWLRDEHRAKHTTDAYLRTTGIF